MICSIDMLQFLWYLHQMPVQYIEFRVKKMTTTRAFQMQKVKNIYKDRQNRQLAIKGLRNSDPVGQAPDVKNTAAKAFITRGKEVTKLRCFENCEYP